MSETEWPAGPYAVSKFWEIVARDRNGKDFVLARVNSASPFWDAPYSMPSADAKKALQCLFAASPDLYEALKYARRFLRPGDVDVAFVDAALAKARGES